MSLQRQSPLVVIKLKLATTIAMFYIWIIVWTFPGFFWEWLAQGVWDCSKPGCPKSFMAHLHIVIFDIPIPYMYAFLQIYIYIYIIYYILYIYILYIIYIYIIYYIYIYMYICIYILFSSFLLSHNLKDSETSETLYFTVFLSTK